jgi:hypothetical protein
MRKSVAYTISLVGVLMLSAMLSSVVKAQPVTQHVTISGYLTCTTCLLPNACKAQTRLGCTEWWVNQGAAFVLVVGEKKYRLSGMEKELLKAAAEDSVTISGDFDGSEVAVQSVDFSHAGK